MIRTRSDDKHSKKTIAVKRNETKRNETTIITMMQRIEIWEDSAMEEELTPYFRTRSMGEESLESYFGTDLNDDDDDDIDADHRDDGEDEYSTIRCYGLGRVIGGDLPPFPRPKPLCHRSTKVYDSDSDEDETTNLTARVSTLLFDSLGSSCGSIIEPDPRRFIMVTSRSESVRSSGGGTNLAGRGDDLRALVLPLTVPAIETDGLGTSENAGNNNERPVRLRPMRTVAQQ